MTPIYEVLWKNEVLGMDITGRKLFVKALEEEGVDTIFGYPGGTVTDLFDELYKQFKIKRVYASRMINSKSDGRGKLTEIMISNVVNA